MKISIGYKFLIPTLVVSSLGMALSSFITYKNASHSIMEQNHQWIAQTANSTSKTTESWLKERQREVKSWTGFKSFVLATGEGFIAKSARRSVGETLKGMTSEYPHFKTISIVAMSGETVATSEDIPATALQDTNPLFKKAQQGLFEQGDIFTQNGQAFYVLAAPLKSEEDAVVGVILATVNFSYFGKQYIDTIKVGGLGFAYLMDEKGKSIYFPESKASVNVPLREAFIAKSAGAEESIGMPAFLQDEDKDISYKRLHNPQWHLVIEGDKTELLSQARSLGVYILALSSLVLTVLAGFLFVLGRFVGQPAQLLAEMMGRITATGDLSYRVNIATQDEIGTAVGSIYGFMDNLSLAIKEINEAMGRLAREEISEPLKIAVKGDLEFLKNCINSSIQQVSNRTAELREKNTNIQAMLSNMKQGLFTIEPSGKIHPEYSRFLEDIFNTHDISGQDYKDLLFKHAIIGQDSKDQMIIAIRYVIGEDETNYDFNAHTLVNELVVNIKGETKYLALDWNPIIDEGIVKKLMVSVRDVTLLKQMESEASSKRRELDIISQLLNISAKQYKNFITTAHKLVLENRAFIETAGADHALMVSLLFRNMHTIKGNSRTFGFTHISNLVHDVESVYSDLKDDASLWEPKRLLADLDRVLAVIKEYEHVYSSVLGRDYNVRDTEGIWLDKTALATIEHCIASSRKFPGVQGVEALGPIQSIINRELSESFSGILEPFLTALPNIAAKSYKQTPDILIEDNAIRVKKQMAETLNNVFTHILTNAVDHGLESAAERVSLGKPAAGSITLTAQIKDGLGFIHIADDGRGLNMQKLWEKGCLIGAFSKESPPSLQQVAELIFESGVSTAEQVTQLSGRGVGMNAVKQFVINQGGDVVVRLLNEPPEGYTLGEPLQMPFELVINLPQSHFVKTEG